MEKKKHDMEIEKSFAYKKNWHQHSEFKQSERSRRGFRRKVIFIVDMSTAMLEDDFKPLNRQNYIQERLKTFFDLFYTDNPLSEIGLITSRDGNAQQIFSLSRNISEQKKMEWGNCSGQISFQVSLDMARSILSRTSKDSCREVILISSSLTSRDHGNIFETFESLRGASIRCSVLSFSPELFILKFLTRITGGDYHTIMNEKNGGDVLNTFITPPTFKGADKQPQPTQLFVGFPKQKLTPTICECHKTINSSHYECPVCGFCYCELPVLCKICGAILLFSHHLARSYHHLFPVEPYQLCDSEETQIACFSCKQTITQPMEKKENDLLTFYQCKKCEKFFCETCNTFIHDVLHNCPGCDDLCHSKN
ncbi:TFIIH basal transcription factor complex subunit [Entamoeba marina]